MPTMLRNAALTAVASSIFVLATTPRSGAADLRWPPIATFSILGYDPATGDVGGAVQSRVFPVGSNVLGLMLASERPRPKPSSTSVTVLMR